MILDNENKLLQLKLALEERKNGFAAAWAESTGFLTDEEREAIGADLGDDYPAESETR
jgi:hypothetical protein